jgi:5'-methylthioadenosine phosphorylase
VSNPDIAVVGGSGFYSFLTDAETIEIDTPYGAPSGPVSIGEAHGRTVAFLSRDPHSFVHVMAPDQNGQVQRWAVEWGGTGQLGAQGVTRETLRPGDVVVITGNPGRNPADFRVRMVTLRRTSDGYGWGERAGETFD